MDALLDVWVVEELSEKHIEELIDLGQEIWATEGSVGSVSEGLVEVEAQLKPSDAFFLRIDDPFDHFILLIIAVDQLLYSRADCIPTLP